MSPETQSKIAMWRRKAAEGTLTPEEAREAILLLRGDRTAAVASSDAAKRRKAAVEIPDADSLVKELFG